MPEIWKNGIYTYKIDLDTQWLLIFYHNASIDFFSTKEDAKYLENIMKIPDKSSTLINERNSKLNTGSQSKLLYNTKRIIGEIF